MGVYAKQTSGMPERIDSDFGYFAGVQLTASVGNYGHIYLFNPASSGIEILVDVIYGWSADVNGAVDLTHLTADPAGFNAGGKCKKLGNPDASGLFEFKNNPTTLGASIYTDVATVNGVYLIGGTSKSSPIVLREGHGIALVGNAVNVATSGFMEWRERIVG